MFFSRRVGRDLSQGDATSASRRRCAISPPLQKRSFENRPGAFQSDDLVFDAFFNAGLRVWDIRDPSKPREVAWFTPPPPERMYDIRSNAPAAISSQDVYVDDRGYCFITDYNAGLCAVELEGEARALMRLAPHDR